MLARKLDVGFGNFSQRFCEREWHFFCWSIFILVLVGWEEGHCNLHSCSFEKSIEILFWWYADEDMLFWRIRMLEERKLSINNSCGRSQGGCSNHPELFRWLPWHRSVKLKREEAYLSLCRKKNPAAALLGSFVFFFWDCFLSYQMDMSDLKSGPGFKRPWVRVNFQLLNGTKAASKKSAYFFQPLGKKPLQPPRNCFFAAKFRNHNNSLTSSRNSMSFCASFLMASPSIVCPTHPTRRFFPGRQTALRRRPGSLLCSSGLSKCKKKGLSRFTGRVHGRVVFGGGRRGGFEWHFYFRAFCVNFQFWIIFFGMGLFFSGVPVVHHKVFHQIPDVSKWCWHLCWELHWLFRSKSAEILRFGDIFLLGLRRASKWCRIRTNAWKNDMLYVFTAVMKVVSPPFFGRSKEC